MMGQEVYARDIAGGAGGFRRFVDLVRLHANGHSVIYAEQELDLLKTGVTDFGLSLDEARGILYSTSQSQSVALESQIDHYLSAFMQKNIKKGRLSRKDFNRLVRLYQTMTHDSVPKGEAQKRVKAIAIRRGLQPRRDWLRLGSRRWFNRVEAA